ncbi:sulfatase family protein [Paenibacillus sp. strain BS8-2]
MERRKPNLIYILADDMGIGDMTCFNNNSKIRTRRLDQLAQQGIAFTDAHASSSVCTPSRYSIMTGRYNWRSRLKKGVTWGYSAPLIEEGRMTVASLMQQNGYSTSCIGKWHLGMHWSKQGEGEDEVDFTGPILGGPTSYGFDYFYGISASLDMPPYVYIENDRVTEPPDRLTSCDDPKGYWREGPTGANFKHEEVLPRFTEKVLQTIEESAEEPFFIYFALPSPHSPILPSEAFQGKSGIGSYGDFVLMTDDVVGQIMDKLEELHLTEHTIVVFTSDNGCAPVADFDELASYGHYPSYVYRGHKADIYEGGHRIPLLVHWPARIAAGSVSQEPVCLVDLLATVADILHLQLPDSAGEDSVSNLPEWLGEARKGPLREAIVHHSVFGCFSIRQGNWKLELCPGSGGWSAPRHGDEEKDAPPIQLYQLDQDIGERDNVYALYPDVVQHLRELLKAYVASGRSTPGSPQQNDGSEHWDELHWMYS